MVGTLGAVSVDVDGEANVPVTLGAATGSTNSVTVYHNVRISVTGYEMTSALGSVSTDSEANISVTLDALTGSVGYIFVWSLIDDDQSPNWSSIDDDQSPSWAAISTSQTPDWEEVA